MGRWTKYLMKVTEEQPKEEEPTDEEKILVHIQEHGSINNSECRELLNVDDARAYYLLKKMCGRGQLKPQKKGKGRRYVAP